MQVRPTMTIKKIASALLAKIASALSTLFRRERCVDSQSSDRTSGDTGPARWAGLAQAIDPEPEASGDQHRKLWQHRECSSKGYGCKKQENTYPCPPSRRMKTTVGFRYVRVCHLLPRLFKETSAEPDHVERS